MASPSWYTAIAPGKWGTLPNSDINASGVLEAVAGHLTIDAWGGGILAKDIYIGSTFTAGTFLVIWGGGHTDSSQNAIYAYGPLENDSPTWNRLRDSTVPAVTNVSVDANGNPVARHTYNTINYVNDGTRNWLISIGCLFRFNDDGSDAEVYVFDFGQISPNVNQPWSRKLAGSGAADVTTYEPSSGRIWYHENGQNVMAYYDIAANTHTRDIFRSPLGYGHNAMSAIDTTRGLILYWDFRSGLSMFRTNNGVSNDWYRPTTKGISPFNEGGGTGPTDNQGTLLYDASRDRFVFWSQFDQIGNTVDTKAFWELIPPAANPYAGGDPWTWVKVVPEAGLTPNVMNTNGTYGRFSYVDKVDIRGYVLLNQYNGPIYFFNPTGTWPNTVATRLKTRYDKFPIRKLRKAS